MSEQERAYLLALNALTKLIAEAELRKKANPNSINRYALAHLRTAKTNLIRGGYYSGLTKDRGVK